jgi:hypothetical protein
MDIRLEIAKQLNFIVSSCRLYDEGRYEESLRIAVAARVLFHNTKASKAIIGGHYEVKDLKLVSTTMFSPKVPIKESHFLGFIGLCPSIGGFRPYLNDSSRKEQIPWKLWWAEEPIMALPKTQERITRRQIILACANKDGGAHVDKVKPAEYQRLDDGMGLEVLVTFRGKDKMEKVKLRYANIAALRQIGHEILNSQDLTRLAKTS